MGDAQHAQSNRLELGSSARTWSAIVADAIAPAVASVHTHEVAQALLVPLATVVTIGTEWTL